MIDKHTCPHLAESSAVFDQKRHGPSAPTSYSPDLTLRDFFVLFPQMKKVLKRKRFADVEEVKQKTAEALKGIKIDEFKHCFEQWKKCLDRCIASHGEHFEGA